jgi:hypothetical protein
MPASTPLNLYAGVVNGSAEGLVLVEQFLNTLDERTFSRNGTVHVWTDELTSADALAGWLAARGLAGPGQGLDPDDLAAARSLRTALRSALSDHSDREPMTQALAGFPLTLVPEESGRLRLSAGSGAHGLDVLVEAVAVGVATGSWSRVKLCASPDCHWAFYDTSRSGRGRWCSMEVCGNRHKTRAYRERHAG